MRTLNSPVQTAVDCVVLTLKHDAVGTTLSLTNTGQVPLRGVLVALRASQEVKAHPAQLRFGAIARDATTPPERIDLRFDRGLQQAVPAYAYPVYVLEFEVVIASPDERITGALYISFQ